MSSRPLPYRLLVDELEAHIRTLGDHPLERAVYGWVLDLDAEVVIPEIVTATLEVDSQDDDSVLAGPLRHILQESSASGRRNMFDDAH